MTEAAGLGRLTVQSALGQPLRAEVEVTSVSREEAGTLSVRLAPPSAFRQANLEFNPALSALRFDLERRGDNTYVVRISSLQPINEPYLDLLLELSWATGRVLREYTVLLDPPALRTAPEVIAPVTPPTAAQPSVAAPQPSVVSPPAAAAVAAPPVPAARQTPEGGAAAAAPVAGSTYTIRRGDTLSQIAAQVKPPEVSLEQMLVALFRANPNAFVGQNMNRMLAGRVLTIPSAADALAVSVAEARQEVAAQSADFAQYRSRLAQAATAASAADVTAAAPAGQGRVTTRVEDKAAPAKSGDQLKIARVEPSTPGAPSKAADDEAVARQRALKEQEERAAELKKANEQLKKALELQSKVGAALQQQAEAKKESEKGVSAATQSAAPAAADATKAMAPVQSPKQAAEVSKADAPKPDAPSAEPAKAQATAPAVTPAAEIARVEPKKPEPPKAAAPASAEPGFFDFLKDSTTAGLLALVVALFGALIGLNLYRKRKLDKAEEQSAGEGLRANSLFGQTGGQSVDTGTTSTFNSSFIPAASQLDSNEVDPVAEADVYIAYGREEQAEEILKEALRLQPDRHAVRLKLLEIYARRGDKASFNALVEELRERTGGVGEEWERAVKIGRAMDPNHPMFATAANAEVSRGPTTELRLTPNTGAPLGAAAAAATTAGLDKTQPLMAETGLHLAPESKLDTAMPVDTRMTGDTSMPLDRPTAADASKPPSLGAAVPLEADLPAAKPAPTVEAFSGRPVERIDFAALDFDLGAPAEPVAAQPAAAVSKAEAARVEAEAMPTMDFTFPSTQASSAAGAGSTAGARMTIPDVDLTLPPLTSGPVPPPAPQKEQVARPTLLGDVGALPDEQAPRLTSNTDQATVPLIDFDLTGTDVDLGGRRTETQAGSPLAAQMATKLDLARGYIDLGVKDGARELLEEVMRDGTREQRQQAVELLKQIEG
ncbi:MAG: FimV/HubP family polar landmark protein [Sutterellaceae bacterium]|nr:pilus assembly protein FimV [Burkholderiaceae bacterium]MCX7901169.1 pilus assembly protein FimV [Burkholderiaceae bacterium]MDW8430713.1 FimV/HubP family polar landmark protein [Sutterellaceae bacterium]